MQQSGCPRAWWRRLLFFAVIGFVVMVAGGPIVGVLAALFSIAIAQILLCYEIGPSGFGLY